MRKKKRNLILLGFIVGLIILGILIYSVRQTYVTEFGWIPLTYTNTQITDLQGPVTTATMQKYSSKFWNISFNFDNNQGGTSVTGGDGAISIYCYIVSSRGPTCHDGMLIFNQNMKNKYFAVDYDYVASPGNPFLGQLGGSGTIEYVPSVLNENISKMYVNGQYYSDVNTANGFNPYFAVGNKVLSGGDPASSSFTLTISNPRYKPAFDCVVDNDEVLIFDEFTAGSVNITSLSYPIQKFCINQPVIIRSFTERGIGVDSSNEVLLQLSQGKSFTVAANTTMRIPYITKEQSGLLRCAASQAWNTKTSQCENILGEGLPDETNINTIAIEIGENQIIYKQNSSASPLQIGDISILPSAPSYTCECNDNTPELWAPAPSRNCYNTNINGNTILYGNNYKINDYLNLDFLNIEGRAYNDYYEQILYNCAYPPNAWRNIFRLNINKEGLKISTADNFNILLLNETKKIKVKINNQFANFNNQNSGVLIRTHKQIIDSTEDENLLFNMNKGFTEYDIPLKTDTFGFVNMQIIPFVKILDKNIYGSNSLYVNYKVGLTNRSDIEIFIQNVTIPGEKVYIQNVSYVNVSQNISSTICWQQKSILQQAELGNPNNCFNLTLVGNSCGSLYYTKDACESDYINKGFFETFWNQYGLYVTALATILAVISSIFWIVSSIRKR